MEYRVGSSYRSQPYDFGGGILFSFEQEGRIREAFVPPDLLSRQGQCLPIRDAVDYVERRPDRFIPAARGKAARDPRILLMLDQADFRGA